MKRLLLLPVLALLFACTPARQTINVVPYPNEVTFRNGVYELSDLEDIVYVQNESLAEEAYVIDVTRKGVRVEASGQRGCNYAMQTLLQMGSTLPCCHIEDAPRFSYRGLHLDEARHFFGKEAVMKYLDIMAFHKLNTFHWHLTDDQGWRIEIKKYPELTSVGSVRNGTCIRRNYNTNDGIPYGEGMWYTQEDIKEIVEWTVDLGFIPTNPDDARVKWLKEFDFSTPLNISPWSHSITVDMDFNCYPTDNLDGAYINNAAYYIDKLAAELKENAENMDPYERYKAIAIIVHLMGDMHCPMHIVYLPDNVVKGHYFVDWKGKQRDMHVIWDGTLWDSYYDWSFRDMAYLVDTASPEEIAEITAGTVYDYAECSARDSWPAVSAYTEGDVLPRSYATDMRPLLFSQLRNGGYRLAAIFNEIFR